MNGWSDAPESGRVREWGWAGAVPAPDDGQGALLMRVLDEIDYGVLLVDTGGTLRYANHLGLRELRGEGPLRLVQGCLRASAASEQAALLLALAEVQRGRRRLFTTGHNGSAISVALVPMPASLDDGADTMALLVFGKRPASDTLTLDFYARTQGLTAAETTVLKAICAGLQPKQVARQQGIAISTVR
ncbi:MAG TPA: helix-turn-helix transcriptional regulator, partial [Albitalea sp.]|nr:helix-turn-helix transcriptional regulator [Albitalea sp.]